MLTSSSNVLPISTANDKAPWSSAQSMYLICNKKFYHSICCISKTFKAPFHWAFWFIEFFEQIIIQWKQFMILKLIIRYFRRIRIYPLIAIRVNIDGQCYFELCIESSYGTWLFLWERTRASILFTTLCVGCA